MARAMSATQIKKNPGFAHTFITHDDYEYLAVEVSFDGQRVCQVFRSRDDRLDIEILDEHFVLSEPVQLRFPLDAFLEAVHLAKRELMALRPI